MEIWIAQEVVEMGKEALREAEFRRLDDEAKVIEVYLAMLGMQKLIEMRPEVEIVH